MSWWNPFAKPKTVEQRSGLAEGDADLLEALGAFPTVAGEQVNVHSSMQIADVFTAVSVIAETIATLPLRVFRQINRNVIETPEHRAARMLGQAPNPLMPAHRFWATVAGHLLLWGNAYLEKMRDENGLVSELWPIHPSFVVVEYNEASRRKRYVVDANINVPRRVYSDDRVLHLMAFSTDGLCGMSPIQQCRQQLGLAKARERFEGEVYAQKPFLSGTITHPTSIRDNGARIRESWKALYGGGGETGRHSVAVLEEGATFNPLTAPLEDMQFVESQQMSSRKIAAMFKLPPTYLGGSTGDSLTYQTVESNKIQLATMAITPVTTNMQKYLHSDPGIFPFSSWYPEFVLEGLLRGDSKARGEFYKLLSDVGAILPNEIRGLENMAPIAGGNDALALQKSAPVSQLEQADEEE